MTDVTGVTECNRIRVLNDNFRSTFIGGRVVLTSGVNELPIDVKAKALLMVKTFKDFTTDNDPRGEHDFGSFEVAGETFFWKIDLYEEPDVKDSNGEPFVTRVLTIGFLDEY